MGRDPEGPGDLTPPRPVTLFMGELVQRRHPALVALVFAFAIFLAAVPFLFRYERSPYPEALTLYDRVCSAVASDDLRGVQASLSARSGVSGALEAAFLAAHLRCVDRRATRATLDPMNDAAGGRAFVLVLHPADGSRPIRFRVVEEHEALKWWPEAPR